MLALSGTVGLLGVLDLCTAVELQAVLDLCTVVGLEGVLDLCTAVELQSVLDGAMVYINDSLFAFSSSVSWETSSPIIISSICSILNRDPST